MKKNIEEYYQDYINCLPGPNRSGIIDNILKEEIIDFKRQILNLPSQEQLEIFLIFYKKIIVEKKAENAYLLVPNEIEILAREYEKIKLQEQVTPVPVKLPLKL